VQAETRSLNRHWAKREKQLLRAPVHTAGLFGDLSGIIGASLTRKDFLVWREARPLTEDGRQRFSQAYEQPKLTVVAHPVCGYKMRYGRMLKIQARRLAAYPRGDISMYRRFADRWRPEERWAFSGRSATMQTYLVAHDLCDPKRLRKVAHRREDFGFGLQYSVFLCRLSAHDLVRLKSKLYDIIDLDADQVLLIPLCNLCADGIEALGKPMEKHAARDVVMVV
jgi:CRISPR-associated protein Cas2